MRSARPVCVCVRVTQALPTSCSGEEALQMGSEKPKPNRVYEVNARRWLREAVSSASEILTDDEDGDGDEDEDQW